jgi:hypothetical protein
MIAIILVRRESVPNVAVPPSVPMAAGSPMLICAPLSRSMMRQSWHAGVFRTVPTVLLAQRGWFARIALCPSGEIGRHSGLKIRRLPEKERAGSIPASAPQNVSITAPECGKA